MKYKREVEKTSWKNKETQLVQTWNKIGCVLIGAIWLSTFVEGYMHGC